MSSSSKRWTSASGAELSSPGRHTARRSLSRTTDSTAASRTLWPSSTSGENNKKTNKASPRAASLADHLAKDDHTALSRQRSCIVGLPRFADSSDPDKEAAGRKMIGKGGPLGRSMRFFPSTKPAGVTLTPGRVVPSDLRRLARDADSGSECSDASTMGSSSTPRTPASSSNSSNKQPPRLLPRTTSVRLLGSTATQWALSPGRRSSPPLRTQTTTVPAETAKSKKGLISLGWGHLFNRRKHATDDASLAAAATLLMSSPVSSASRSRSGGRGSEAGHQMRMAHCRLLQWRFATAREDAVRRRKQATAEVELLGAWATVAEMTGKVARKRVQLHKEQLNMKLNAVLSSQMKYLDSWEHMHSKHADALSSTVDCARAAVCRVPLTNGAKVSTMPSLASTLQYVLDLVVTTKTTTRPFGPTVQETRSLVSELVRVAREEQALLQECLNLLSCFSTLQVEEQSLRCHLVQTSSPLTSMAVE